MIGGLAGFSLGKLSSDWSRIILDLKTRNAHIISKEML